MFIATHQCTAYIFWYFFSGTSLLCRPCGDLNKNAELLSFTDHVIVIERNSNLYRIVDARARERYRIWLKFADGTEGEVDLSYLAGKGVFSEWAEKNTFAKVDIGPDGELIWPGGADLCPDSLYMKVTGLNPDQVFPKLRGQSISA